MATLNEKLLHEVLALSVESRKELVEKILASFNFETDKEVDAAWEAEIERRIKEVASGAVELISEDQVYDEMRSWLKK